MSVGRIAIVMSGFPRCSETFALAELAALQERGQLAAILATRPGDARSPQPGAKQLQRHVVQLPAVDSRSQAQAAIRVLRPLGVRGVHGYFAHRPARVAGAVAAGLGVPFGFSTHARDALKVEPAELGRRARAARCVIACNPWVADRIERVGGQPTLLPHGVDTRRFHPEPWIESGRFRILAVGRLVEKKGFGVLLEAVARLRCRFELRIVGVGPEREPLERKSKQLGIESSIEWVGPRTHRSLPSEYRAAHVIVLPSIVLEDGDRDGTPNVLLEAMASARAVVATRVGGIPSALPTPDLGRLVSPGNPEELAAALERLAGDPESREELGRAARGHVEKHFAQAELTRRFCSALECAYA